MTAAQTRILALAALNPHDATAQEEAARVLARQGVESWFAAATRTLNALDRCKAAEPCGDVSDEEVEAWEEELAQWEEAAGAVCAEAVAKVIACAEGFGHADSFGGLTAEVVEAVKILGRAGAEFRVGDWQPVERVAASPEALERVARWIADGLWAADEGATNDNGEATVEVTAWLIIDLDRRQLGKAEWTATALGYLRGVDDEGW